MSFDMSGTAIQRVSGLIQIDFSIGNEYQVNYPLNLGSLMTQTGTLTADDQNGNGGISAGETIDHNNTDILFFDTIPDLSNATVLGVGYMGGIVSGLVVRYPVILVASGSSQYLIYPEGPPDLLTQVTGTLNTTLHFYANAQYYPGGGVPCFAGGTRIRTRRGEIAVEALRVGDSVLTVDDGYQPIRWIGSRHLSSGDLAMSPQLRPIRIRSGALGAGVPEVDLVVSPQHRVLVQAAVAERMLGEAEVLVAAKHLLALDGVEVAGAMAGITYWHILFDGHQLVFSAGAVTESLYTGSEALKSVSTAARDEIFALFPQLLAGVRPSPARPLVPGRLAARLAERISLNGKALVR
ncbi:Hint domain-containing protein [Sinirhodobacter huangdaonensis]|nr:Hint domain-containing protein [Sinirhodobacter huangdaonensis]